MTFDLDGGGDSVALRKFAIGATANKVDFGNVELSTVSGF